MKIKLSPKFKEIVYFGLNLVVYKTAKFIAIDKNGAVYSFSEEPKQCIDCWIGKNTDWVAEVNLEDLDWRETLIELE